VHSSIIGLNNFISEPVAWTPFLQQRTYPEYLSDIDALPAAKAWLQRLDTHLRQPLLNLPGTAQKPIHIYAHFFGHQGAEAAARGYCGVTGLGGGVYAWPTADVAGGWPTAFLHPGPPGTQPRPSFKPQAVRDAYANLAYFLVKHFENVGSKVYFSPWREINFYSTACASGPPGCHCELDTWDDLLAVYQKIVERIEESDVDLAKVAVYPSFQLEAASWGAGFLPTDCVLLGVVDRIKTFYQRNEARGVPFQINLSAYPEETRGELGHHQKRLRHLLDSLYALDGVPCDKNGNGGIDPAEGVAESTLDPDVSVAITTPLSYGEASRPGWLDAYKSSDPSHIDDVERRGAAYVLAVLNYAYRTVDGATAYPLDNAIFTSGPEWMLPGYFGGFFWVHFSGGLSRGWLTSGQPKPAQLLIDQGLDPDNDWDNDGVLNLTLVKSPFAAKRDVRRGLDDFLYRVVPRDFGASIGSGKRPVSLDELVYVRDNCPYAVNPTQADTDGDGFGDACDNCLRVANQAQVDFDQDGYGVACDPDLDNDGQVNVADSAILSTCVNDPTPYDCLAAIAGADGEVYLNADLNADGVVNGADVTAWSALQGNAALQASGLSCAGQEPCPDPTSVMLPNGSTVTIPGP